MLFVGDAVYGYIKWLGQGTSDVDEPKKGISDLKPDDQALYQKIVRDLLRCCDEAARVIHPTLAPNGSHDPLNYALIFRQSRSWKVIETRFQEIESSLPRGQPKITRIIRIWVQTWQERINKLREAQLQMRQQLAQLQGHKRNSKDLSAAASAQPTSNTLSSADLTRIRDQVKANQATIKTKLLEGQKDLAEVEAEVLQDPRCVKLLKEMKEKWLGLTVCFEWPEVSPDDEKMFVQVRRPKQPSLPNIENLINSSTKAIFFIEEKDQEEIPLEYEGVEPGKIIRPKKIDLKKSHLAPASPLPTRRASAVKLKDEVIFDTQFAQATANEKKIPSSTALHLERIVKLALNSVNQQLSQGLEAELEGSSDKDRNETSYNFNRFWCYVRTYYNASEPN